MSVSDMAVSLVIELTRTAVIFLYFDTFMNTNINIKNTAKCAISFLITAGSYILIGNSIVNVIATLFGILIISTAFNGKARSKLLLGILCYSIMITIDFAAYYVCMGIGGAGTDNIAASSVSILIFYITVMLLKLIFRKKMKTELIGQWYVLLLISVMSVCLLVGLYRETSLSDVGIVYLSVIMLVMNLLLYVFYSDMQDRYGDYKENEYLKQQIYFHERQLKVNIENDRRIKAIRHDMKHHIREINALAARGDIEEIKSYTSQLAAEISQYEKIYDTGNPVFDGVLNYYISMFEHRKIKADINVVIPEKLNVSSYDLNIVLGNLFDNAMENAMKAKEPLVIIDVNYTGGVLYISVANTYDGRVRKNNDTIISSKGDDHGYGLENIRRIAVKYNGSIRMEYNDKLFITGVMLYV